MKAYKVVSQASSKGYGGTNYYSNYYSHFATGVLLTCYRVGEKTYPKHRGLPLYAFKNLEQAQYYVKQNNCVTDIPPVIFECDVTISKATKYANKWLIDGNTERFWKRIFDRLTSWDDFSSKGRRTFTVCVSNTALLCSSITLLREVKP